MLYVAAALSTESVLAQMMLTRHVYKMILPNKNIDVTVYLTA
jgi:hypothetical protein